MPAETNKQQQHNNKIPTKQMLQQTSLRLFSIPQRKGLSIGPARFLPPTGAVSPQTSNTSAFTIQVDAG